jgi:hypothetical protein
MYENTIFSTLEGGKKDHFDFKIRPSWKYSYSIVLPIFKRVKESVKIEIIFTDYEQKFRTMRGFVL